MKLSQVAFQLYTVRDFCKTPAELRRTLRLVKKIGYPAVQASGHGRNQRRVTAQDDRG